MSLYNHFVRVPAAFSTYQERGMCQRFLQGKCPFSALACSYSHNKDQAPLCSRWKNGQCIGATGNNCLYRHYYMERDHSVAAYRSREPLAQTTENFSSPYRVQIRKEKLEHNRVEVDLETGEKRSWVEEEEREVMDLTGESPPAKPTLPPSSALASSPVSVNTETPVSVDSGTCPVCSRSGFAGERGVARHRNHKNSKCKVAKENLPSQHSREKSTTAHVSVLPVIQSEVIIIPDTPTPANSPLPPRRLRKT